MENNIKIVTPHELKMIIEIRKPFGLFMAFEGNLWVAVDNETGDAWTEDFKSKETAEKWLRGEFEVSE